MNWQKWIGAAACVVLIISCFMHWAYYPDIQKHFTGFNTETFLESKGKVVNYYGKPGLLLCIFAGLGFIFHIAPKIWAKRANLLIAAICVAYAVRSYFMYSAEYRAYKPEIETGLLLMLAASIVNLIIAVAGKVKN